MYIYKFRGQEQLSFSDGSKHNIIIIICVCVCALFTRGCVFLIGARQSKALALSRQFRVLERKKAAVSRIEASSFYIHFSFSPFTTLSAYIYKPCAAQQQPPALRCTHSPLDYFLSWLAAACARLATLYGSLMATITSY
jgi:hypothetical protein